MTNTTKLNLTRIFKMKKVTLAASLLISCFSFSAFAAQLVSQQEVDHYKLVKVGSVNVAQTGGAVSSPSFEAFADVYKDAKK